jgi:hypothetical protein
VRHFARYSIALSAGNRTDDGIVRPRAVAVLRLTTNSNLAGCSNGQFGRPCSFQDLVHVAGGATEEVRYVRSIGHQTPEYHRLPPAETACSRVRVAKSTIGARSA